MKRFIYFIAFLALLWPSQVCAQVKATATPHNAELHWTSSSGTGTYAGLGYNIYRGTAPGAESLTPINASLAAVGCTTSTTCTYIDLAVIAGTTYYYALRACIPSGICSNLSNEVSATIPLLADDIPPPTGITAAGH